MQAGHAKPRECEGDKVLLRYGLGCDLRNNCFECDLPICQWRPHFSSKSNIYVSNDIHRKLVWGGLKVI